MPCPVNEFSKPGSTKRRTCSPGNSVKEDRTGCESCPRDTHLSIYILTRDSTTTAVRCIDPRTNCKLDEQRITHKEGFFADCQPRKCPPGSFEILMDVDKLTKTRRSCLKCQPGQFVELGLSFCNLCPADSLSNGGTVMKCKKCPPGLFTGPSGSDCKCVSDVSRESVGLIDRKCVTCPAGTFGIDGDDKCTPCPAGTYQSETGQKECGVCRAESFSSKPGSASCQPCPSGSISFGVGETSFVVVGSLEE